MWFSDEKSLQTILISCSSGMHFIFHYWESEPLDIFFYNGQVNGPKLSSLIRIQEVIDIRKLDFNLTTPSAEFKHPFASNQ